MDTNSLRGSSRQSKSVVFPRINADQKYKGSRQGSNERAETASFGPSTSKDQNEDLNKYILERLDRTERALEVERQERTALEELVRRLMVNVQGISKDMVALENAVKSEESNAHSQNVALKNLEMHQVSGIGDVWNRLTLADLNTIKLSGDLNKLSGEVSDVKRSQGYIKEKLEKCSKDVQSLVTRLEKTSLEYERKIQLLKVEQDSKFANLERSVEVAEKWNEKQGKEKERSDGNNLRLELHEYSKTLASFRLRFDQFVENQEAWREGIDGTFSGLYENLLEVKAAGNTHYEDLTRRLDDLEMKQKTSLEKSYNSIKDSYREAFRVVYESITTMQTVLEAKLKMTEADLKTSINSILKTMSQ
ncbi:protein FAM81A-like [Dendronephthya gigantea]|uniref:protein FAM81A-like n=1 Tax=Dendronephthya gigantea TaxID=151771 RepID=UPI00106B7791|nr:protein FAM81A-like [Dendronephthya gigantea]